MKKKFLLFAIPLVIAACGGLYFLAHHQIKTGVDRMIARTVATGRYKAITYQDLDLKLNGAVQLDKVHVTNAADQEYVLEQLELDDYDYSNEFPHHVNMHIRGVSFPGGLPDFEDGQNPVVNEYFNSLLNDDLLPVLIDYRYDDDHQLMSSMGFSLENSVDFNISSSIRKIPLEEFFNSQDMSEQQVQQRYQSFMTTAEIPKVSFALTDRGFVDSLISIEAGQNNMDPEVFRSQLAASFQSMYFALPQSLQDFARQLGDEAASFLEGHKTFNASMTPEFGGNIQQLQTEITSALFTGDLARIVELLNLEFATQ